ncbi:unnamed protein product [Oncorhynchus mykiss]|uniref:Uncharacterized protein n=1 Tax=Oncorhynchus mykiss TaxID=8022 RepID=A0A060WHL3_ONCMY|nr:unnamed protein product [Oncorhynchus mykiss]
MLRHQTTDQRSKREQLKENRKALLNAQLAKVRQRKMKTKLDGTQNDQGAGPKQEEDEAHEEAPAVKKLEVEIQQRRDTKSGVPHIREWDRGKGYLHCVPPPANPSFTLLLLCSSYMHSHFNHIYMYMVPQSA